MTFAVSVPPYSESPPVTHLHNILIAYIPFITIWYSPWMCILGCICLSPLEMRVAIFVLLTAPLATLFKKIIYFNWRLITLQYCAGFCHTLTWISMGVHVSPILNPPPSHPIPLGCPSAPALSALFNASNLDWWSVSHMVIYMFQCYSLKSSHPHLLPRVQKSVLFF